jgi:CubicO group peptidase (beta-lactamase class C family)
MQVPVDWPRPALPAGHSVSSARDLARFAESLLDGRLLQKSTLDRLVTPEVAMDNGAQRALGFEVDNFDGVRLISHGGNSWGVSTQLDIYPEAGVVVVILSNSETSGAAALAYKTRRWVAALAQR